MFRNPGEEIVLRSIYNDRICYAQSVTVIEDTPQQTVLLLLPGAQCAATEGYFTWRTGDNSRGSRWDEALQGDWQLREFLWNTNRFLILLWPEKYYAVYLIWEHASGKFVCHYVNFQLPFKRSSTGFDTFDLELDIIIHPDFTWEWKDMEDYEEGIQTGALRPEWISAIQSVQDEVLAAIERRDQPFDGAWLNWRPAPDHTPATLPAGWEVLK